jgi:hypothetical protein
MTNVLPSHVWIEQFLEEERRARFDREVDILARVIYPRPWGNEDSAGPCGRVNSAREWAREGLSAVERSKPRHGQ